MRHFYAAALLLLASCAHPQSKPAPESEPIGADTLTPPDSLARLHRQVDSVVVLPHRSLIDKVFGRKTKGEIPALPAKIGKKSTVSIYYGPATVTTTTVGKKATAATAEGAVASVTGKKSGPAVVASDSATLNNAGAGGNLAAVNGDGNTLEQTAVPPPPKPGLLDTLKGIGKMVAWGVGIAAVGLVLYEFAWPLLLGWFRRKSTNNQA